MPQERCPVCGVKVKSENLPRHLKRIHPDREVTKKRRPGAKRRGKALIALVALVLVTSSIVSALILWPTPNISVEPEKVEMGTIQQQPEIVFVTVKNAGNADLKITELTTSCVCTSVVFQFGGRASPSFAGPDPTAIWAGETLAPGQSGTLEITYNPAMFQDVGPTVRYVYVTSNDPDTPDFKIELRAVVTP